MLTPRFELSQTENEVIMNIIAPYANIKDTVIHIDGTDFCFYSTPYYLRLSLPAKIEENNTSAGDYNCDTGEFKLKFSKVNKNEYFENLDMITSLLTPSKKQKNLIPVIETISNPCCKNDNDSNDYNLKINKTGKNYIQEDVNSKNSQLISFPKYGFGNKISGSLHVFENEWIKEIIDLPLPDKTLSKDRKRLREYDEIKNFNEEHYMADFVEFDYVQLYLSYKCEWEELEVDINFNKFEIDILKDLPNKEYLMDENDIRVALYGMIDILFANCYNHRTTLGENTVESGWTINKLSSTLSWFQNFNNMKDVILSCIRRSLCYPLIRNWNLSLRIFEDVKIVIKLGKKYILKRFCEIYFLFNTSHEPRYILNQLYIQDYLIWLQQIPNSTIDQLYLLLENIITTKEEVDLDLTTIEEAIYIVKNENLTIGTTLSTDFEKLIINNENADIFALKRDADTSKIITLDNSSRSSIQNNKSINSENFMNNKNETNYNDVINDNNLDSDDECD